MSTNTDGTPLGETPGERESREDREHRSRNKRYRELQLWFNGVLMGATVLTFGAMLYQGCILKDTLTEMVRQSKAAEDSAQSARDGNRPWMTLEIKPSGPMVFSDKGALLNVQVIGRNVGHSPATNIGEWVALIEAPVELNGIKSEIGRACEHASIIGEPVRGRTLFPHPSAGIDERHTPPPMKVAPNTHQVFSLIVACLSYCADFSEKPLTTGNSWLVVPEVQKLPKAGAMEPRGTVAVRIAEHPTVGPYTDIPLPPHVSGRCKQNY